MPLKRPTLRTRPTTLQGQKVRDTFRNVRNTINAKRPGKIIPIGTFDKLLNRLGFNPQVSTPKNLNIEHPLHPRTRTKGKLNMEY